VIADGVFRGYVEARSPKRLPERWWHATPTAKSNDWVSEIANLAQRPGAQALAPQYVAAPVMDTDTLRQRIAEGRAEAIAASRRN
jgi:hypothetical protein